MQPTTFGQPISVPAQVNRMAAQGVPGPLQQTQGSPNFQPSMVPPANSPMPQKSPMANFAQGLSKPKPTANSPENLHSRADLIIKALTSHLAALDKLFNGGATNNQIPEVPQ